MCSSVSKARFCFPVLIILTWLRVDPSSSLLLKTAIKSTRPNLCIGNGLDVLRETRNIQKLSATFDLDSRKVYYKLKFCKKVSICFASSIDHGPINEQIVNKMESWAKLIRVIQGKGRFMPYIKGSHSKEYGGPNDYYNCTNGFYIITHKPNASEMQAVTKNLRPNKCLSDKLCTRTCLHKTEKRNRCHEIRIACNFNCTKKSTRRRRTLQVQTSNMDHSEFYMT